MTVDLSIAKKLNNYASDATTPTAYWPSTTHYIATVPAGKRWSLFGGHVLRDVSSVMIGYIKDSADKILQYLAYHAASTGSAGYPLAAQVGALSLPIPMDTGEYVDITFGVAQGAGAYGTAIVLEVNI